MIALRCVALRYDRTFRFGIASVVFVRVRPFRSRIVPVGYHGALGVGTIVQYCTVLQYPESWSTSLSVEDPPCDPICARPGQGVIVRREHLTGSGDRLADSQRSFPRFRRRYSVSSRREMNLRISKFPFQALSCNGSRWSWKTKGRRKRPRSPRRD
jgi:hypothetical protein